MKVKAVFRAALMGAGVMLAGAAKATTTIYDEEGTQLSVYGRISIGVAGGGPDQDSQGRFIDNDPEFVDIYSRLGFRMRQQINPDLAAFGHLEWRFAGDERIRGQAFRETRQSYIGLESERFGTVLAGNFNSLYYQFVSVPFDVYLDRGLLFNSSGLQSRGDSIGYFTPEINGFTSFVQVKHYGDRGLTVAEQNPSGSETAFQGGIRFRQGPLSIGLGAVENEVRGGGNGETLYGLIGSYDVRDNFTARAGVETQSDSSEYGGGFDSYGLGGTFTTGAWAFNADVYRVERDNQDDSNAWTLASYYTLSSNFDVFLEVSEADSPAIRSSSDNVYWITGARYLF
ncbi:porin [Halomonas sp. PAMB 3232]|uniref:porin n=1 Tax=Halomonas sp. PAMB 3232 TaxID=3075221 RepID=UPI002896C6EA|nr:porin [Halomonas sp. PAMB 3232]WNL40189.1 porin [Halomonas sp. PAMB 3232]